MKSLLKGRYHYRRRIAILRSQDWLRTWVVIPCIDTLTHEDTPIDKDTHAGTDNESNVPKCTDWLAVAALDSISNALYQHAAEFLHRWYVSKCKSPISEPETWLI